MSSGVVVVFAIALAIVLNETELVPVYEELVLSLKVTVFPVEFAGNEENSQVILRFTKSITGVVELMPFVALAVT